jgi:methylated-DNA-[protein]-cysteine S-methyltransferase
VATYYHYYAAPFGELLLAGDGQSLSLLGFPKGKMARRHDENWIRDPGRFRDASEQLDRYFAGKLKVFELKLELAGTPFQKAVWAALKNIPYGATCSYGEIAEDIGRPKASRAVGAANGINPVPIIIPCHRVVGSNGALTGFGGGLSTKRFLLSVESGVTDLFDSEPLSH